jgi:hypothetical protein
MARLRESILKWGNKYDGPNNYKNNRRGGAEDAFWDEDELVDYQKAGTKKKRSKKPKKVGCPGNEGKGHVYVWTTEFEPTGWQFSWAGNKKYPSFHAKNGYHRMERKVCAGCNKGGGYRYTDMYYKAVLKHGYWKVNYGE